MSRCCRLLPRLAALAAVALLVEPALAQLQFAELAGGGLPPDSDDSRAVALGDVDGDGDLDLLVGNGWQQNRLYRNDGRGDFVDVTATHMPVDADETTAVALGDVDGDGDLDLLIGNSGQQDRLYRNDGSGHFTDDTAASLPVDTAMTAAIAFGDVDGDGDLDVAFADLIQDRLYLNDSQGHFVDATASNLPPSPGYDQRLIAFGDVDGDGDLDLAMAFLLYRNDGAGVFTDVSATSLPATHGLLAAVGDVDGDGDLDLIGVRGGASPLAPLHAELYANDGTGVFTDLSSSHMPPASGSEAALGDIDGDQDLDLVLIGHSGGLYGSNINSLCLNDGTGHFADVSSRLPAPISPGPVLQCMALGDVDGDEDLDLVYGEGGPNPLLRNLRRQLHAPLALTIGQTWTLDAYLRFGPTSLVDLAVPYAALAPASIPIPGLGTLGLDPTSLVQLPLIPIAQPAGTGSIGLPIPSQPSLVGLPVFVQALTVSLPVELRLGNVVAQVVQ